MAGSGAVDANEAWFRADWGLDPGSALPASDERWRTLVRNISDIVAVIDEDGTLLYATPAADRILGYGDDSNFGRNFADFVHPDDITLVAGAFADLLALPGVSRPVEFRLAHADGSWTVVEAIGNNLLHDPAIGAMILNVRDITERRLAEDALRASEERFHGFVERSSDLIITLDLDDIITYANPTTIELVGSELVLVGRPVVDVVHPGDADRILVRTAPTHCRVRRADGVWRDVEVILTRLTTGTTVNGHLLQGRDVTEHKREIEQLAYRASHDPLTGLANRRLFMERLEKAMSEPASDPGEMSEPASDPGEMSEPASDPGGVALLFVDLDDLKVINDTQGHAAGDGVLCAVADRLQGAVRPTDLVARYAGDEFTVLCEAVDPVEAMAVAHRILDSLARPVRLGTDAVPMSASIGVAVAEPGSCDAEEVVRRADRAMYLAKKDGRARCRMAPPA